MRALPPIAAIGALLLLSACGTNPGDRITGGAVGGALIGGGIGAFGGPLGAGVGAAVGGGTGAALGAFTSPQQFDIGAPPWSDPTVRSPTMASPAAAPAAPRP